MPKHGYVRRATPKSTRRPTRDDLKWAAGFLEGEGCFGRYGRSFYVHGTQVGTWALRRLKAWFGGRIRVHHPGDDVRQRSYRWYVTGARARGVALTLYILLSPRRQRAIRRALAHG